MTTFTPAFNFISQTILTIRVTIMVLFVMKHKIGEEHRPKTYTTTQNAAIGSFSKKQNKKKKIARFQNNIGLE